MLAASGLGLLGFLVVHLLGNLTIYQGRDAMNAYADWLQGHPLLWLARAGLIGIFLLHTTLALRLAWSNHRARPRAYHHARQNQESTILSRYIALTGLMVLAFVVFHLLHFTLGGIQSELRHALDAEGRHDVYGMVVQGFRAPEIAVAYLVAMALLGLHLLHGLRSLLQTFGLFHETYIGPLRQAGWILVGGIVAGNASIPLSVWLGWITP